MLRPLLFGFAAVLGVGLALGPQAASAGGLPCGYGARCDIGPAYHRYGPVYRHFHRHHHHHGYARFERRYPEAAVPVYRRVRAPFYGPAPVEEYGPPVPAFRPAPIREVEYYPPPAYRSYHAYRYYGGYRSSCGGLLCGLFCGF